MTKRKVIEIDEKKCNGCGACVPDCPEGALQIIDGKARLISDIFCDGLGACIGTCPEGAIQTIEREALLYDERRVMLENIIPKGNNTITAHLEHLKSHGEEDYLKEAILALEESGLTSYSKKYITKDNNSPTVACGCPGAMALTLKKPENSVDEKTMNNQHNNHHDKSSHLSELRQWPIKLYLVPPTAGYLNNSHILVAADCVTAAMPQFHSSLLRGKILLTGCPKFDRTEIYVEKLTEIFRNNNIKSVTAAIMQVPCCSGLYALVKEAVSRSGKDIPVIKEIIALDGHVM